MAPGCSVIVKTHSAHPDTSEAIGRYIHDTRYMPLGTFALLQPTEREIAQKAVADPQIRAVGFTALRQGGLAILKIAAKRKPPIPVYDEMSSINPVLILPGALKEHGSDIGTAFINSLCLGAG